MAAQHVYMYKDGVLVWDSPCVTGNVSKNHTTPEGIFTLTYKETDRVLRERNKRTAPMNMKAMWITGCRLTEGSVSMTPTGGPGLAGPYTRQREAMAV
jgi:hypothetical protein